MHALIEAGAQPAVPVLREEDEVSSDWQKLEAGLKLLFAFTGQ